MIFFANFYQCPNCIKFSLTVKCDSKFIISIILTRLSVNCWYTLYKQFPASSIFDEFMFISCCCYVCFRPVKLKFSKLWYDGENASWTTELPVPKVIAWNVFTQPILTNGEPTSLVLFFSTNLNMALPRISVKNSPKAL